MICDHRNFTLGQLEAGCWPAMSWLLAAKAPCWPCLVQQWLPASSRAEGKQRIRSSLSSSELCPAWGRKSNRGSRDPLYPKRGDEVDTEKGPVGDRRVSKLVLLVVRREREKMEEEGVWKHNGKGR